MRQLGGRARDRLSRSDSLGACRDSGGFGLNSGERGFNDSDVRPHVSHRLVEDGIDIFDYVAVLVGHDASGPDAVAFAARAFGGSSILCSSTRIQLADAMINDEAQRLWLLQFTADNWGIDALDPEGVAVQSVLPQFFGNADQPDALAAIRAWTACLFASLNEQDKLVDSGALGDLQVPVSVIFGESERYLDPSAHARSPGCSRRRLFTSCAVLRTGLSTINPKCWLIS